MSLRVSGRSFSGWLSALETVPNETPASRATSLILTFAIAAPLMRFKYKPDCSIACPRGAKTCQLGTGLFWQVLSGETTPPKPPRRGQAPLWWFLLSRLSIVSICNIRTVKPALPVIDRDIVPGPNRNVSICNTKPAYCGPDVTDRDLSPGSAPPRPKPPQRCLSPLWWFGRVCIGWYLS